MDDAILKPEPLGSPLLIRFYLWNGHLFICGACFAKVLCSIIVLSDTTGSGASADLNFYFSAKEGCMSIKNISIIVLLFLFAFFVVQNAQIVEVRFLLWKTEASRAIVLLVTFGVGMLAGWLSGLRRKRPLEFSEEHLSEKG